MKVIFGLSEVAHLTIPSRCDYVEIFHTAAKWAGGGGAFGVGIYKTTFREPFFWFAVGLTAQMSHVQH